MRGPYREPSKPKTSAKTIDRLALARKSLAALWLTSLVGSFCYLIGWEGVLILVVLLGLVLIVPVTLLALGEIFLLEDPK